MNRVIRLICATTMCGLTLAGCGNDQASDLQIESLPEVHPTVPAVPTIPPPPYPVRYPDNTYSVYGARKRIHTTMDTELEVTGYIVQIYTPPECPEGQACPPARAPHLFIADSATEADPFKRLRLVGYADNQTAIDEAVEAARRGRPLVPNEEEGERAVPYDFNVGGKIKVHGRFTRVSATGFSEPDGVLEYQSHTMLEPGPNPPVPPREAN